MLRESRIKGYQVARGREMATPMAWWNSFGNSGGSCTILLNINNITDLVTNG